MLNRVKDIIYPYWKKYVLYTQPLLHAFSILRLRNKKKKKIVFFATFVSTWKHDTLYELLEESNEYEPIILVIPVINLGHDHMLSTMDACYSFLLAKGYRVIKAYDSASEKYYNPKCLNPDVIVYLSPYNEQVDSRYRITRLRNILSIYMPYGFALSSNNNLLFNQPLHNLAYRVFYETSIHKQMASKYAVNGGANVEVSGSLISDKISAAQKIDGLNTQKLKKTIIWAPHHTIDEDGFSSFLQISQLMLDLAIKYKDVVNWVFKPHPILKSNLYNHSLWGKQRTDEYYQMWGSSEFSTMENGEYAELFVESDALILDSISFVAEYLFVNKPMLFTSLHPNLLDKFNDFGKLAMKCVSRMHSDDDVELFINNILKGKDELKHIRETFFDNVLKTEISPSQYVFNFLKRL